MNYKQALGHYGGPSKLAQALGIQRQNVNNWKSRGRIPSIWQLRIEHDSKGLLKADLTAKKEAVEIASYLVELP